MAIDSEVKYRLKFTCDGCDRSEFHDSEWSIPFQGEVYLPSGWMHFYSISVSQINDVRRTGKDLDFCDICVSSKNLQFISEKLPFDNRSLKSVFHAVVKPEQSSRDI